MHRSRAPSIAPGTFFVAQLRADCITNMPGFNLRQAHEFGVVGYLFKKLHYPLAPLVLAMVIGDKAERRFARDIFQQYTGDDADPPRRGAARAAGDLANHREDDGAIAVKTMTMTRQ
jgi:hypothetical protein